MPGEAVIGSPAVRMVVSDVKLPSGKVLGCLRTRVLQMTCDFHLSMN